MNSAKRAFRFVPMDFDAQIKPVGKDLFSGVILCLARHGENEVCEAREILKNFERLSLHTIITKQSAAVSTEVEMRKQ